MNFKGSSISSYKSKMRWYGTAYMDNDLRAFMITQLIQAIESVYIYVTRYREDSAPINIVIIHLNIPRF